MSFFVNSNDYLYLILWILLCFNILWWMIIINEQRRMISWRWWADSDGFLPPVVIGLSSGCPQVLGGGTPLHLGFLGCWVHHLGLPRLALHHLFWRPCFVMKPPFWPVTQCPGVSNSWSNSCRYPGYGNGKVSEDSFVAGPRPGMATLFTMGLATLEIKQPR